MNCRPSCATECPHTTDGTRCADYRRELQERAKQIGSEAAVDVPYRLQRLGVPTDAIIGLRKASSTAAIASAKRWEGVPRHLARTLLLAGPRGIGKTVAAAYVLAGYVRKHDWNSAPSGGKTHPPFVWACASEVTAVTDFGRVAPEWVEGLKACQLLVLDDLGEDGTVPGVAALADVLKTRHEKHRATVITTNLPVDAPDGKPSLRSRYGDSWYERLKVAAIAPNLFGEKSLRKKGIT